jgi:hypothetical protein
MKRSAAKLLVLAGVLLAGVGNGAAQAVEVLFVGNSFTHGYDPVLRFNRDNISDLNNAGNNRQGGVPGIFKAMATSGGYQVNVSIEALSGTTLSDHLATRSTVIGQAKWQWVVLQESSTRPLTITVNGEPDSGNIAEFRSSVGSLSSLIWSKNADAKILLYETWARPNLVPSYYANLADMQEDVHAALSAAVRDYGLTGLAPVGSSFFEAIRQGVADNTRTAGLEGPVNLWFGDAYHASAYGSYLSALIFYQQILGADPRLLSTGSGSVAANLGLNAVYAQDLAEVAYLMRNIHEVPEPSVIGLLGCSAIWWVWNRRRKRGV